MNNEKKLELKLNKKNVKNLSLDSNVLPTKITGQIGGAGKNENGDTGFITTYPTHTNPCPTPGLFAE